METLFCPFINGDCNPKCPFSDVPYNLKCNLAEAMTILNDLRNPNGKNELLDTLADMSMLRDDLSTIHDDIDYLKKHLNLKKN